MGDDQLRMTLGEHLDDLRRCLIRAVLGAAVGVIVCLFFQRPLFGLLFWPLGVATAMRPPNLNYLSLPEPFSLYVRVSLLGGLILSSPYWLYQMWKFIAAGLYARERRAVRGVIVPGTLLFLGGVAFYFVLVSPVVVRWFLLFAQATYPAPPKWGPDWWYRWISGSDLPAQPATQAFVQPVLSLDGYVSFTLLMSVAFGLAFEMPLVVLFLMRTGLVPAERMRRARRYVVVIITVAAAVITPTGDAVTLLVMAVPMYLLFELGLLMGGKGAPRPERPAG